MKFLKAQNRNIFGKLLETYKDGDDGVNNNENDRRCVDPSELFAEPLTVDACRCFHVLDKVLPKYLSTTPGSVIHQMHFEQFMENSFHLLEEDDYDYDDDEDDDDDDDEEGSERKKRSSEILKGQVSKNTEMEVDEDEDGHQNAADDDDNEDGDNNEEGEDEDDDETEGKKTPPAAPTSSVRDGRVLRKRRGTCFSGMVPSSYISASGQWKPPSTFPKETTPKHSPSSEDIKDTNNDEKDNDNNNNEDEEGDDDDDEKLGFGFLQDHAMDLVYPQIKGEHQAENQQSKRKQTESSQKNGTATTEKKSKNQLSDDRYRQLRQAEMDLKREKLARRQARKSMDIFGVSTSASVGEEEQEGGNDDNGNEDKEDNSSRKRQQRRQVFLRRLRRRRQRQEQNEDYILSSFVEEWLEVFRRSRVAYWQRKRRHRQPKGALSVSLFGSKGDSPSPSLCCQWCPASQTTDDDDYLMQCLECSAIGCAPGCINPQSKQHIMLHFLSSGHSLGVTLGARGELFCVYCGDCVYHEVFDQERERIDIQHTVPWLGWRESVVQRSLDPLVFVQSPDGRGVMWRGMVAKYPLVVPNELREAARLSRHRAELFRGTVEASSMSWGPQAMTFALHQRRKCDLALANNNETDGWKIGAPVGMYNMGNTCYINCVLQCLVNCVELQRHFLHDVRHDHEACQVLRVSAEGQQVAAEERRKRLEKEGENVSPPQPISSSIRRNNNNSNNIDAKRGSDKDADEVCLACEMDRLLLQYYSSSIGMDLKSVLAEAPSPGTPYVPLLPSGQGQPLILSNLLMALWKCRGMKHLAGYEQRDAHEFLQAFLDIVGKHASHYQEIADTMAECAVPARERLADGTRTVNKTKRANVVKHLFEGTLRSNLICSTCGHKRSQPEPFLNISLPLAKEMERSVAIDANSPSTGIGTRKNIASKMKISVRLCLEHFTKPEKLMDPVQCPECQTKTPHRKQHTFAKLPTILCLHLKRFDAATNRKISDPVSFPAHGLDMGPLLPHWCEEIPGASDVDNEDEEENATNSIKRELTRAELIQKKRLEGTLPQVLYDLVGTVNHSGTLNQGHYVSNVKIDHQWYHCNDTQVFPVGGAAGTTTTTTANTASAAASGGGGGSGTASAMGNKAGGSGEQEVLQSDGAYILFYRRRA